MHLPLAHYLVAEWWRHDAAARAAVAPALHLLLLGSLCGVVGFVVKTTQVPERWRPLERRRRTLFFDVIGASHQWWHLLTIVGPLLAQRGNFAFLVLRGGGAASCPAG